MKIIIAIEIGEEYLKIVAAKRKGMHSRIINCVTLPVLSLSNDELQETIGRIFRVNKYKPRTVELCLPRNFVTTRNLHLPSDQPEEITKMIDLCVSRIVPYEKEEVAFSYRLSGKDKMGYTRIVLAIVHNDLIRNHIKMVEKNGVLVDRVTLSSYGIWQRVFELCRDQIDRSEVYLILDIDTTFTEFIMFDTEDLLFTRNIAIKIKELNTELGKKKLLGETRQSLLMFDSEELAKKPARIFLSGQVEEGLKKIIEDELKIPVTMVPEPVPEEDRGIKDRNAPHETSLTAVSDIALGDNNKRLVMELLELQIRKSMREKTKDLIILGSSAVCFLVILFLVFLGRGHNEQLYLNKMTERSKHLEQETQELLRKRNEIGVVENYLKARAVPLYIIYRLQRSVSEAIAVSFIRINDNKITLRGQAAQLSDIFNLVTLLEKEKNFKEVQISYTRKAKAKDGNITDFELAFLVKI